MKATHGEYSAFTTKNSVRYLKDGKLVAFAAVPPEVMSLLNKQLGKAPKFAPPTEEEKARLRAESLQVAPELQVPQEKLQEDAAALVEADFAVPEVPTDGAEEGLRMLAEEPELATKPLESDFLEKVSIHSASLEDIVEALYNRFGIYTVHLKKLPVADEINPITGEQFSNYHLGIAYQAAISAQSRGILDRVPEEGRRLIDEGRAASANFKVDAAPQTMGEARRANSFEFRTSVNANRSTAATEIVHVKGEDGLYHAVQKEIPAGQTGEFNGAASRYDAEEDERLVEPQMGKVVIRPNW